MGVGKTSLGRILSKKLQLPFVDSDKEIEKSTGFSINELFAKVGSDEFRLGEERIMNRLLNGSPCVLSSGGGAFLSEKTRLLAKEKAVSIWLKAGTEVICRRTQGRTHRPLVPAADNRKIVEQLIAERYPIYEKADLTIESYRESPFKTVSRLLNELEKKGLVEVLPDEEASSSESARFVRFRQNKQHRRSKTRFHRGDKGKPHRLNEEKEAESVAKKES